jgi:hypothetical protein
VTDYPALDDDYNLETRQVLYDRSKGINYFDGPRGGHDTAGSGSKAGVNYPSNFRFLLADEEGYGHVHCGPAQPMTVEVAVYELDNSYAGEWAGALYSAVLSGAVGAYGGGPVGGTLAGWVANAQVSFLQSPDYIGSGSATLKPNGNTEIEFGVSHFVWWDDEWYDTNLPDGDGKLDLWVPAPATEQVRPQIPGGYRSVDPIEVPVPGEPGKTRVARSDDGEYIGVYENRGSITISTTTREVGTEIFDHPGDYRLGEATASQSSNCHPTDTALVPPSDDGGPDFYESADAAVALAASLNDQELPGRSRDIVANRRVNVHVGDAIIGVHTGSNRVEHLSMGGYDDATFRVNTDPETARSVAYASDKTEAVKAGLQTGTITYEGVGIGPTVQVEGLRFAADASKYIDRRIVPRFPTRYDIGIGESRQITFHGEEATLHRNSLGHRTVDTGHDVVYIVNRSGTVRGVNKQGTQRLVRADSAQQ